ncbi:MAG: hypothetical protein WBP64_05045 [Nitrososphaeraceae archaeon]
MGLSEQQLIEKINHETHEIIPIEIEELQEPKQIRDRKKSEMRLLFQEV